MHTHTEHTHSTHVHPLFNPHRNSEETPDIVDAAVADAAADADLCAALSVVACRRLMACVIYDVNAEKTNEQRRARACAPDVGTYNIWARPASTALHFILMHFLVPITIRYATCMSG